MTKNIALKNEEIELIKKVLNENIKIHKKELETFSTKKIKKIIEWKIASLEKIVLKLDNIKK